MDLENIQLWDLIEEGKWDHIMFHNLLGPNLDSPALKRSNITPNYANVWVWFPSANNNRLSSFVYNFLNSRNMYDFSWNVWLKVWKLNVAPRIKFFTWLLLFGRILTYDYLNVLNMAPPTLCVFCGNEFENMNYLFFNCFKIGIFVSVLMLI